jgi:hypothetical protein
MDLWRFGAGEPRTPNPNPGARQIFTQQSLIIINARQSITNHAYILHNQYPHCLIYWAGLFSRILFRSFAIEVPLFCLVGINIFLIMNCSTSRLQQVEVL